MRIERADAGFDEDAAVLALLRAAFAGMAGRIDPPSSLDAMGIADIAARRRDEALWLARDGARIVGCAFVADRGDHAYLGKLAVAPGHTRRGIARLLVERVAAEHPVIRLQTRVELVENHAAFARMGFVETGRTAHPGHPRPTSVTMERRR